MSEQQEPVREAFATESEMAARADALRAGGFTVVPIDNPERGLRGFAAFLPAADGADALDEPPVVLEWPMFGRPLQKDETEIRSAEELVEAFKAHGEHPSLRTCSDPLLRTAGLVCHCRASDGKSVVFTVRLTTLKSFPKELLERLIPGLIPGTGSKSP